MKEVLISVIIPAYNEEKDINQCLESLEKQSYKNIEIIVVDDGSTDKTREIIRRHKSVKLIEGEHKGPGFSRNLGAKQAKGEILVFVDADMTFDKDYVKNLVKPILDGKYIGTEENQHYTVNMDNIWSRVGGDVIDPKKKKVSTHEKPQFGSIFRAIKKDVFMKHGGFDPSLGYSDDQTFYIKYGLKSFRVESAICYHKNPQSLKELYKQSRWIGSSLNSAVLKIPVISYFIPILLYLVSPIAIPFLSVKRAVVKKMFNLLFPWIIIYMAVKYFGTVSGIWRKVYLGTNVR